jgi:undecaprenyl-diphosphatase
MNHLQAFIMGVVEGVSEFLPISSTGHLILTAHILGIPHDEFTKSFEITIQLGSILAILFLYSERLRTDLQVWKRIILGFIPTGVVGFLLYKFIKGFLLGNELVVVISLILGGIVLILIDLSYGEGRERVEDVALIPLHKAFIIGFIQALAVIPGVSRSGATIGGGMLLGLSRKTAAEFSFLLAIPTMFSATFYDLLKTGGSFSSENWSVLAVGFVTAFVVSTITVKALLAFLNRHGFLPFGIYRIALGSLYAYFFIA